MQIEICDNCKNRSLDTKRLLLTTGQDFDTGTGENYYFDSTHSFCFDCTHEILIYTLRVLRSQNKELYYNICQEIKNTFVLGIEEQL